MDKWKLKELKALELGGNKNARAYYDAQGMVKEGRPDHESAPHARYKMELAAEVEKAISADKEKYQAIIGVAPAKTAPTAAASTDNPFALAGAAPQVLNVPSQQAE